jgi:hypothetical protein
LPNCSKQDGYAFVIGLGIFFMAENKKSVLLYCDILHTVKDLSDEEAGRLFKHYLLYINDFNPEPIDRLTGLLFEPIKQNLKRDLKKWEDKSLKNKENALLRWNANASERIERNANYADKDKDKDKDKVIVNKLNTVSASRKSNKKIFKVETPKEIQLPFETENFKSIWKVWNEYRWNEKRQRFKSVDSEHAQLKHLFELSGGNESDAIAIINQSIGNQYTGLFQLKTKPISNAKNNGTTASNSQPWRNQ